MAKFGIALGSGPRGRGFESRHSDQKRKWTLFASAFFFWYRIWVAGFEQGGGRMPQKRAGGTFLARGRIPPVPNIAVFRGWTDVCLPMRNQLRKTVWPHSWLLRAYWKTCNWKKTREKIRKQEIFINRRTPIIRRFSKKPMILAELEAFTQLYNTTAAC